METILEIPLRIIKEQELIIGPLAWDEAKKVNGLVVNESNNLVSCAGDTKEIINRLVAQYERIFGKASHAVCRDAVKDLLAKMSPEEIPSSLR